MIKVGIEASIEMNGVVSHASANIDLVNDIYNELFASSPTKVITPIDKVSFLDSNQNEIYSITLSSSDFSLDSTNHKLTVSKQFTYTGSSASVSYIRLLSGADIYFIASVSTNLYSGKTYTLNITISINHSITSISPSTATISCGGFLNDILKALYLAQASRPGLTFIRADWGATVSDLRLSQTLTNDSTNRKTYHTSVSFTSGGSLRYIYVYYSGTPTGEPTITIDLGATYTVTTSDTADFSWSISVT